MFKSKLFIMLISTCSIGSSLLSSEHLQNNQELLTLQLPLPIHEQETQAPRTSSLYTNKQKITKNDQEMNAKWLAQWDPFYTAKIIEQLQKNSDTVARFESEKIENKQFDIVFKAIKAANHEHSPHAIDTKYWAYKVLLLLDRVSSAGKHLEKIRKSEIINLINRALLRAHHAEIQTAQDLQTQTSSTLEPIVQSVPSKETVPAQTKALEQVQANTLRSPLITPTTSSPSPQQPNNIEKIPGYQDAVKHGYHLARELFMYTNAHNITAQDLKKHLPYDILLTPYLLGYVQGCLWTFQRGQSQQNAI